MTAFRERLLITLIGSAIAGGFEEADTASALEATNAIAGRACREWGHDWDQSTNGRTACRRCGAYHDAARDPS